MHGKPIGNLSEAIKVQVGHEKDIPVICVPSHDTAAAVAAIPAKEEEFLFISSGTWALIGAELDEPIINEAVFGANLTNEVGAFNKITMLKNSTGMFILEKMKAEYEESKATEVTWETFLSLEARGTSKEVIEVNSAEFFNPESMIQTIIKSVGGIISETIDWGLWIDVVERSMAKNYAQTVADIEKVIGKSFESLYIVGGGSRNSKINQLTAEYTKKEIIVGGVESTSLGNIGVQLNYFNPEMDLKAIRAIIASSIQTFVFKA